MKKMVEKGSMLTVTRAVLSILQTDHPVEDFSPAGRYNIFPDWSSLRLCPGSSEVPEEKPKHASVMCFFRDGTEEVDTCPRTVLSHALRKAKEEHGIDVLVGFETEVIFLDKARLVSISNAHSWSTSRSLQNKSLKVLEQIVDALEQSGIEVLLFHPESAASQYEIVTGPLPALESVDALYHIRETIWRICAHHDIRATLHPKPFQELAGTAAHMHMSISPPTESLGESFFAGILSHLGSLAALTMPMSASYSRLKDGCWAGGTWIAWGKENREVPLRLVSKADAHWELRCIDGLANAYLALSGVVAAGSIGIAEGVKLPGKSCDGKHPPPAFFLFLFSLCA
jgi:glutamine synthetase